MRKSVPQASATSPDTTSDSQHGNITGEPSSPDRVWAEIDLAALRHNLSAIEARASSLAGRPVGSIAVVKADAYGHGLEAVAKALAPDVQFFGVACLHEALRIDAMQLGVPIFLLGPTLPEEATIVAKFRFTPSISTRDEADVLNDALNPGDPPLPVHVVIDTGMGRIGALAGEALALLDHIRRHCPRLQLDGLASHYPAADEDSTFTREQTEHFDTLLDHIAEHHPLPPHIHLANSAGLLTLPCRHATLVRPGLALFGESPVKEWQNILQPVLSLKSRITLVRNIPPGNGISYGRTFLTCRKPHTRIATIAIGYADGLPRAISGRNACVLIHGQRCPILGRVTMDQILVDTTDLPQPPAPGDTVVIIGQQDQASLSASELATKANTIPWEILTNLAKPRIQRHYLPA